VFEIAFDPAPRINATFISPKFNPAGSERWEEQGGTFDIAFIELQELIGSSKSIEGFKEVAIVIHMDTLVGMRDMIRNFGYPLAEDRRAYESFMYMHSSERVHTTCCFSQGGIR
jgi:hypothetical protein